MEYQYNNTEEANAYPTESPSPSAYLHSLKALPLEKLDHIARQMLSDPLLQDITPDSLRYLTEYDIEKMMAKERGEIYPLYLRRADGVLLGNTIRFNRF